MMRLSRDLGAADLISGLRRYGYAATRQSGSHLPVTARLNGEHHVTIPQHKQLRVGTVQAILIKDAANHLNLDWRVLAQELFDR